MVPFDYLSYAVKLRCLDPEPKRQTQLKVYNYNQRLSTFACSSDYGTNSVALCPNLHLWRPSLEENWEKIIRRTFGALFSEQLSIINELQDSMKISAILALE